MIRPPAVYGRSQPRAWAYIHEEWIGMKLSPGMEAMSGWGRGRRGPQAGRRL